MSFLDGVSGLVDLSKDGGIQQPLVLLTMMIDDSTSMRLFDNFRVVMQGHNSVLGTLEDSAEAPLFMARTQYMHGKALASGYRPLCKAPRITEKNYKLIGGSPLFRATCRILRYVERRAQEYKAEGNDVRTVTLLLTDGWNREFSKRNTMVQQAREMVEAMFSAENHIVAGAGVAVNQVDFREVFLEMGIPERWILTLRSKEEIRAAFGSFCHLAQDSIRPEDFAETRMMGWDESR